MIRSLAFALLLASGAAALAHNAPSGWSYPAECCSSSDCEPLPASSIRKGEDGWHLPNGQVVPFGTEKKSGDDFWHWCRFSTGELRTASGRPCFYMPSGGV